MLGFFTSKIKVPNVLLSSVVRATTLGSYFIGYAAWLIVAVFSKDAAKKLHEWYSVNNIKTHQQMAGALGLIAATLCIIYPALILPAMWLYTFSNIHWLLAERSRNNHPPMDEPDYSSQKQSIYYYYSISVTLVGLFASIPATIIFFFPLSMPLLLPIASAIGLGLTIVSLGFLAHYFLGNYPPDKRQEANSNINSIKIKNELTVEPGNTLTPKATEDYLPVYNSFFKHKEAPAKLENVTPGLAG